MNMDIVWSNLLNELKDELSSLAYNTWFNDTKLHKLDNGIAYIVVPMPIPSSAATPSSSPTATEALSAGKHRGIPSETRSLTP